MESHPVLPQNKLLRVCKQHGIILTAYSPFAGSPFPTPDGAWAPCPIKERLFASDIVKGLAAKYKKTPAQVLLKFHVSRGVAVLAKSVTKARIAENLDVFDFELTPEELQSFQAMATGERMLTIPVSKANPYYPYTDDE